MLALTTQNLRWLISIFKWGFHFGFKKQIQNITSLDFSSCLKTYKPAASNIVWCLPPETITPKSFRGIRPFIHGPKPVCKTVLNYGLISTPVSSLLRPHFNLAVSPACYTFSKLDLLLLSVILPAERRYHRGIGHSHVSRKFNYIFWISFPEKTPKARGLLSNFLAVWAVPLSCRAKPRRFLDCGNWYSFFDQMRHQGWL